MAKLFRHREELMERLFQHRKVSFTAAAKRALQGAEEEARRLQHGYIGTEHLLLGLLHVEDAVTARLLTGLGVELGKVRSAVEAIINRGDQLTTRPPPSTTMHPTPRVTKVLALAVEEALYLGQEAVDTPHLLLGLVRESRGIAAGVLESLGAKLDALGEAVESLPADAEGEQHGEEPEGDGGTGGSSWWEQVDLSTVPGGHFDKLTARAKKVFVLALEEALRLNHNYLDTEHLLLGLVREGKGTGSLVLGDLGVDLGKVRSAVEFGILRERLAPPGDLNLNPRAKQVIALSFEEAHRLNHTYVGTEHLLLALVREAEGYAAIILSSLDVQPEQVRQAVQQRIGPGASEAAARLRRTRSEQSLRKFFKFFSESRDNVLSIRVDDGDVAAIDALVEAGVLKTRSETAAWLIKSGIEANRDLFEQVQEKTAEIRRLREETQELIHRHVAGADDGADEGTRGDAV